MSRIVEDLVYILSKLKIENTINLQYVSANLICD